MSVAGQRPASHPPASPPGRRVAVTGLGALTALGPDVPSFLAGIRAGRCGIREITLFDTAPFRTHTGGELSGFDPADHFTRRERQRLSRADMAGLVAAGEALAGAGLREVVGGELRRMAVFLGGGVGGLFGSEVYFGEVLRRGWPAVPTAGVLSHFPSSTADRIAERFRLGGPRGTVVTACSASSLAIGQAFDAVRFGEAEAALAGGSDTFSRLTYSGFNALRSVDPGPCRPFDLHRRGLSLGEGAAILVLEPLERARARGARVHAEILGYGMSSDAHHMTAPDPAGEGAALAMRDALAAAGVRPQDVGYINAHGTGTPQNDAAETVAVKKVFGDLAWSIPVSSTKSMLGHCLGSAGAVEALATILALGEGFVPPTVNLETPDPGCDLDYVPRAARRQEVEVALSNSFAFGGNNGVLVFRRIHDR